MSEAFIFILIAVGGLVTVQNAVVGYTTGKIEMRSVTVDRAEKPQLFWFVLTTEVLFTVGCIWMIVGWMTGSFSFEGS